MAIVGACKNEPSNQLPAWTPNSFAVFLERDPAGFPPDLRSMEGGGQPPGEGRTAGAELNRTSEPGKLCEVADLPRSLQASAASSIAGQRIRLLRPRRQSCASLEVRFFFDIRAIGSIPRRTHAPERPRGHHAGRGTDLDRGDRPLSFPAAPPVLHVHGSVFCGGRCRRTKRK